MLMTVEQSRRLPSEVTEFTELQRGELVPVTQPKMRHTKLQRRLLDLLEPMAKQRGVVMSEMPFRPLREYEFRRADVAFTSQARWDQAVEEDELFGSPELVIEILSPSNTKAEMRERAALCLSTGCQEFWVVDPVAQTVGVTDRSGQESLYQAGSRIPLPLFASELELDAAFL